MTWRWARMLAAAALGLVTVACKTSAGSSLAAATPAPEVDAAAAEKLRALCEGIKEGDAASQAIYADLLSSIKLKYVSGTTGDDCKTIGIKIASLAQIRLREPRDLSVLRLLPKLTGVTATLAPEPPVGLDVLAELSLTVLSLEIPPHGAPPPPATVAAWTEATGRIKSLRHLKILKVPLASLAFVQGLVELESLDITATGATALAPLEMLPKLKRLDASANGITDAQPLANLLTLERLDLSDNQLSSIDPLIILTNITDLDLGNNQQISSIFAVSEMPNLMNLSIRNAALTTVDPLKKLASLTGLDVQGNKITDLAPLAKLDLFTLDFRNNQVTDLTPLAAMTRTQILFFDNNPVTVFPALQMRDSLQMVSVVGVPLADPCPVLMLPNLRMLRLQEGAAIQAEAVKSLASDRNCGSK